MSSIISKMSLVLENPESKCATKPGSKEPAAMDKWEWRASSSSFCSCVDMRSNGAEVSRVIGAESGLGA